MALRFKRFQTRLMVIFLGLFGAPVPHPDAASRAVRTALGMEAALDRVNREYASRGASPIHIGVGINTDEVVVGNMGTQSRLNYTVIGDGVNLASRLEGLTKHYGVTVVVSDSTRAAAPGFVYQELDLVRVKGKTAPVRIFRPLAESGEDSAALRARLAQYEAFLVDYRQGDFTRAEHCLAEYEERCGEEDATLIALYRERLVSLKASPPPDWDGVWTYDVK